MWWKLENRVCQWSLMIWFSGYDKVMHGSTQAYVDRNGLIDKTGQDRTGIPLSVSFFCCFWRGEGRRGEICIVWFSDWCQGCSWSDMDWRLEMCHVWIWCSLWCLWCCVIGDVEPYDDDLRGACMVSFGVLGSRTLEFHVQGSRWLLTLCVWIGLDWTVFVFDLHLHLDFRFV